MYSKPLSKCPYNRFLTKYQETGGENGIVAVLPVRKPIGRPLKEGPVSRMTLWRRRKQQSEKIALKSMPENGDKKQSPERTLSGQISYPSIAKAGAVAKSEGKQTVLFTSYLHSEKII